jgi:hypothetical protein
MTQITRDDLIDVLEIAAHGQLRALRALRKTHRPKTAHPTKGKSNITIVEDILRSANSPLHINQILEQARRLYARKLSRESLVSALTKKVLDQQTFCRVGRNTFDLINRTQRQP